MAKISVLSPHVADLIAAGEVVERPASVVKELMENAIDAGAFAITVEIKNGGMAYIRVTDNGCGMSPEDAETAFLRHATSKLRDERGLEAIGTLGFRGEALAAISAVSRVELYTRERGSEAGVHLFFEGGELTEKKEAGCPDGTTMIVRNLFFNTPARLKFMKNDKAEGAAVTAAVTRCALSHPEVSVRYIKDDREECHTPGDGNIESCVYSLFGRDFASGMLKTEGEDDGVSVSGFVSSPSALRGNRTGQYFFVNGRYVKSKTLQAALEQAYKNSMFTGRFPACILYIGVSFAGVDVNVHPAKTEVKFLDEKKVFDCVYYAVLSALSRESEKAEITLSKGTISALSGDEKAPRHTPVRNSGAYKAPPEKNKLTAAARDGFYKTMDAESFRGAYSGASQSPHGKSVLSLSDFAASPSSQIKLSLPNENRREVPDTPTVKPAEADAEAAPYRIIGEAMKTYILVEKGESLFLIDKHAAHERVIFDRLKLEERPVMKQLLITPVVCDLGAEDAALLLENAGTLDKFGFDISDFGGGRISIHQVPADIFTGDARGALEELCEKLRVARADPAAVHDDILHTVACKMAIKAGASNETEEFFDLVEKVMSGEVKYCPHGRPVAMELKRSAIDRNFKRS